MPIKPRSYIELPTYYLLPALTGEKWKMNVTKIVDNLEIDLYCASLGVAMELNGPWHYSWKINLDREELKDPELCKKEKKALQHRQNNDARKKACIEEMNQTMITIRQDDSMTQKKLRKDLTDYVYFIIDQLYKKDILIKHSKYTYINPKNNHKVKYDSESIQKLVKKIDNLTSDWEIKNGKLTEETNELKKFKDTIWELYDGTKVISKKDPNLMRIRVLKVGTPVTITVWLGYFLIYLSTLQMFDDLDSLQHRAFVSKYYNLMEMFDNFRRSTELSMGSTYGTLQEYSTKFGVEFLKDLPTGKLTKDIIGDMPFILPTRKKLMANIDKLREDNPVVWDLYKPYLDVRLKNREQLPSLPDGVRNHSTKDVPKLIKNVMDNIGVKRIFNKQMAKDLSDRKKWMQQKLIPRYKMIYFANYIEPSIHA